MPAGAGSFPQETRAKEGILDFHSSGGHMMLLHITAAGCYDREDKNITITVSAAAGCTMDGLHSHVNL